MGKINKDQQIYLDGLSYALRIAKAGGIEALEKEVQKRGLENLPLNVNHRELTAIARGKAKEELMIVATALADTVSRDMKLPPSIVADFLRKFNGKVALFRDNKEEMERVQLKLDSMSSLVETVRKFNEED